MQLVLHIFLISFIIIITAKFFVNQQVSGCEKCATLPRKVLQSFTGGKTMAGLDRRVQYTRRVIRESFLALLEKSTIKEITVKEICELADINRATFYRHYAGIDGLYESVEAEIIEDAFGNDLTGGGFKDLLLLMQKYKAFYKEVFRHSSMSSHSVQILSRIKQQLYDDYGENWKKTDYDFLFRYMVHGTLGILREWIEADCVEDAAKLAEMIGDVVWKQLRPI